MGGIKTSPYSPDLNPCDYDGISRVKRPNKGKRFSNELALGVAYDEIIRQINLQNATIGISRYIIYLRNFKKLIFIYTTA